MKKRFFDRPPDSQLPWWQMEPDRRKLTREARQYIRKVCGITIVFWSKDTIYVDGGCEKIIINRWYDTRRNYQRWNLMCDSLKHRNQLDMTDIRQLVVKHGFETCGFTKLPPGVKKLAKLEEEYKWRLPKEY